MFAKYVRVVYCLFPRLVYVIVSNIAWFWKTSFHPASVCLFIQWTKYLLCTQVIFLEHQRPTTFKLSIEWQFQLLIIIRHTLSMSPGVCHKFGWKWSNGVGRSQMNLFWCISITNDVKSCNKINENAWMVNFSVFARRRRSHRELFAKNMENWGN